MPAEEKLRFTKYLHVVYLWYLIPQLNMLYICGTWFHNWTCCISVVLDSTIEHKYWCGNKLSIKWETKSQNNSVHAYKSNQHMQDDLYTIIYLSYCSE